MIKPFLMSDVAFSVFTAFFLSQVVFKIITFSIKRKKVFLRAMVMGGGMPSSHTALVTALAVAVGLNQGFRTPLFIAVLVFSVLAVYDVLLTKKAVRGFLILLAEKHPRKELLDELGHSVMEVLFGVIIGLAVVLAFYQH